MRGNFRLVKVICILLYSTFNDEKRYLVKGTFATSAVQPATKRWRGELHLLDAVTICIETLP